MMITSIIGLLLVLVNALLNLMPALPSLPVEITAVFTAISGYIGTGFTFASTIFGGDWFVSTLLIAVVIPLLLFDPAYKVGLFIYKRVKS